MNQKNFRSSLLALLALAALPAFAQSTGEKVKDAANDTTRAVKKGVHRTTEALCVGTKAECAKKKLEHRVTETRDDVRDKAVELKDKVDSDSK